MIEAIEKYFPGMSERQRSQMEQLGTLYPEWNAKINVISRKDIGNLYVNHVLHSLAIAKFMEPPAGTRFMDLGTGGGFPGIPLAIMFPRCSFHLLDRIGKKLTVASSIAEEIGLENVTFQHGDVGECHQRFDFVVSRAVMPLADMLPVMRKNVYKARRGRYDNGLICLKGGDLEEELASVNLPMMDLDVSYFFDEPYFQGKKIIYLPKLS